MLFNSNTTAITKYRGATQKADHSIKRLEGTLLERFVCAKEGDGKPQSFTLYKCCGQHQVCLSEEYLSEHLAPPAPADAGSSSAAGREEREECDECGDECDDEM